MAVNALNPNKAAQGYRENAVAGLNESDMLNKGLHGLVVYLHRAKLIAESSDESAAYQKAAHLSDADRLLSFLLQVADAETEMGGTLIRCYTGIQQLITASLNSEGDESLQALDDALGQARALEGAFKENIGGNSDGQAH